MTDCEENSWEWSGRHGKYDSMSILFEITTLEKYGLCTGRGQFLHMAVRVINFSLGDLKCAVALRREFQFTNMEKNTSFDVL